MDRVKISQVRSEFTSQPQTKLSSHCLLASALSFLKTEEGMLEADERSGAMVWLVGWVCPLELRALMLLLPRP